MYHSVDGEKSNLLTWVIKLIFSDPVTYPEVLILVCLLLFQDRMYHDPKRWSYLFQSYVLLTMMEVHNAQVVCCVCTCMLMYYVCVILGVCTCIRAEIDSNFYHQDILNRIFLDILWIVTSSVAIETLYFYS